MVARYLQRDPGRHHSETVAVITLTRNARQPAYQVIEQVAMVELARKTAPILHHLAVQHLQRASEIKADKGSLYRGEALEAHRTHGQEGTRGQLSPAWSSARTRSSSPRCSSRSRSRCSSRCRPTPLLVQNVKLNPHLTETGTYELRLVSDTGNDLGVYAEGRFDEVGLF